MDTWLTETAGIDVPLIQAPMARVSEGAMAAAVCRAGALGMIGVGPAMAPATIAEHARVAAASGRPYGIGLMAWALEKDPAPLDAVLGSDATVVSVSFGAFEGPVQRLRDAGKLVTTQVGNLEEAQRAERAGVDFLVARGREGGGHGRDDVATLPLLQIVLDAVDLPVVAAGGIATARGLAAVLAAGAVGAWVGTAFLCCRESTFPAASRARLIAADDTSTAYGRVFDIAQRAQWPPEYGGRALRNPFFDEWVGREDQLANDEGALDSYAQAQRVGDFDASVIYAGQGAALLRAESTAADVVASLVEGL
jgi:nitronate monooxygenase